MSDYVTKTNMLSALARFKENTDALYETKADANEMKSEINQHDARITNLEQKAGDYGTWHYPNDPNHSSDMPNKVPTGKAKYGLAKSIVGKTRAWNQLVNTSYTNAGIVCSGTHITIDKNNAPASINASIQQLVSSIPVGHTVLLGFQKIAGTLSGTCYIGGYHNIAGEKDFVGYLDLTQNGLQTSLISNISKSVTDFWLFLYGGWTITESLDGYFFYRDLTTIFPEGVPSTIAECVAKCPDLLKSDAYDAGSLVDTEVSGVKSVGFNIWNEQTRNGYYDNSGVFVPYATVLANKNLIPVSPATLYCSYSVSKNVDRVCFYDASENFISYALMTYSQTTNTFTTPPNCSYINFNMKVEYGDIYLGGICINVSGALDGTYKPHVAPDTLSLSETVTLKSAGEVSDEYDPETGVVTRKVGSVDLGGFSINWHNFETGSKRIFYTSDLQQLVKIPTETTKANIVCSLYVTRTYQEYLSYNKSIIIDTSGDLAIYDSSHASDDNSAFKSAMSGVYLNYELATPTTESIDPIPDNTIYTEGGGTVDTIQTQSPVIDNCLDVGYLAV